MLEENIYKTFTKDQLIQKAIEDEKEKLNAKKIIDLLTQNRLSEIDSVFSGTKKDSLLRSLYDVDVLRKDGLISEFYNFLSKVRDNEYLGFPTGFNKFDEKTLGLRGLMLLASQPNAGKTALALNIALNALQKTPKLKLIYISLDMGLTEIVSRIYQILFRIDYHSLINHKNKDKEGNWSAKNLEKIEEENKDILERITLARDIQGFNEETKELEKIVDKVESENTLIIIDYLQIIKVDESLQDNQADKRRIDILNELSLKTRCPVLAITEARKPSGKLSSNSSKNKNNESTKENWVGGLSDLMGSARLSYTPDMVFILSKGDGDNCPSDMVLNIAKIRDGGQRGTINFEFDWRKNIFEEIKNQKTEEKINSEEEKNNITMDDLL